MTNDDRSSIRRLAEEFLRGHHFNVPPINPEDALQAQGLHVEQLSLDELLVNVELPAKEVARIQAMLDTRGRFIVLREGLHRQQRIWGGLHEIGHDVLPWHRDLLYHCPLWLLPRSEQHRMELEADTFAAEVAFFGVQFQELAARLPFGLEAAVTLARETYGMSLHSTMVHYVLTSSRPCTLLVWEIIRDSSVLGVQGYKLHQYVTSEAQGSPAIPTGQSVDVNHVISRAHLESCGQVVSHPITVGTGSVEYQAQSFSNTYKVFTLIAPR